MIFTIITLKRKQMTKCSCVVCEERVESWANKDTDKREWIKVEIHTFAGKENILG